MGARSIDELIGRVELLRPAHHRRPPGRRLRPGVPARAARADADAPRRFVERVDLQDPRSALGDQLLADAFRVVWDGDEVELALPDHQRRAVGRHRARRAPSPSSTAPSRPGARPGCASTAPPARASAPSSPHGVELELVGEANDYVGKGMGGGRIVIRPPADDATLASGSTRGSSTVLAGNTCLYGATGGELFVAGAVGERFAVRNSGAVAVVEAVGDHCCEYMTGGTVVVLGRIGYNLGAGMTGGQAFLWDPEVERVLTRVNPDLVAVLRPEHDDLGRAALAGRAPRRADRLGPGPRAARRLGRQHRAPLARACPAPAPRPSSPPPPAASPPPDPVTARPWLEPLPSRGAVRAGRETERQVGGRCWLTVGRDGIRRSATWRRWWSPRVFAMAAAAKLRDLRRTSVDFEALGVPNPEVLARLVPLAEIAVVILLLIVPAGGGHRRPGHPRLLHHVPGRPAPGRRHRAVRLLRRRRQGPPVGHRDRPQHRPDGAVGRWPSPPSDRCARPSPTCSWWSCPRLAGVGVLHLLRARREATPTSR